MQDEGEALQKMVNEYCDFFYNISTQSVFKPGTHMTFQVVEFDLGIVLKIHLQVDENAVNFGDKVYKIVWNAPVTSAKNAFKKLHINWSDYLSEAQEKALNEAAKNNIPYFKGTKRFYGTTMDEICYIKEKKEKCWNLKAIEKDLDNFIKDSFDAS